MPLSGDQCALVEKNHQLVYGFLWSHQLNIEKYEGACEEGLCKAALTFNPAKGTFSTWAYFYMANQVRMEMRYERKQIPTESLEPWMSSGAAKFYDGNSDIRDALKGISARLKPRDQKVLRLLLAGRRQTAIAAEVGCSQTQVSRIKMHVRIMLKEMITE